MKFILCILPAFLASCATESKKEFMQISYVSKDNHLNYSISHIYKVSKSGEIRIAYLGDFMVDGKEHHEISKMIIERSRENLGVTAVVKTSTP